MCDYPAALLDLNLDLFLVLKMLSVPMTHFRDNSELLIMPLARNIMCDGSQSQKTYGHIELLRR
jgi:hypothetical protein